MDVDSERLIRRTAELTILNPNNQFSPRRSIDVDTDADNPADQSLVGYVYLNRYVKIERGVHLSNKQHIYAPVGIFMIDVAEVIAERNMTIVNLTLSDLAKRLSKSILKSPFPTDGPYPEGTGYNKIIRDLLDGAGITQGMIGSIDSLSERETSEKTISNKLRFERGDSRGEKLKELCDKWDIDIYFNPVGKLVTEDLRSDKPLPKNSIFTFSTSDQRIPGQGAIVSLTRTLSDDNLFNHLIIIGTKNDKDPLVLSKKNEGKSRTSIKQIGDRVKFISTDRIGPSDTDKANKMLEKQWKRRLHFEETIKIDAICIPNLEGNDIITILDDKFTNLNDKNKAPGKTYRIKKFNVPLVTSKQSFELVDTVTLDEL